MAHKGIREFSGEESGNIALGQLGFTELTSAGTTDVGKYVAFKLVGPTSTDKATMSATCFHGDDMTATPIPVGELLWGCFKTVTMASPTDGDVHCYVYYGRL